VLDAEVQARLAALVGHDGSLGALTRELAGAIRTDALDARDVGVVDALWAITAAKLAVANPGYVDTP